jgi:dolichol-phosphate mannosyltransferase
MSDTETLVVLPTYDEAATIELVVDRIRASVPPAHVLVVDDSSPDGTGDIADRLAAHDDHVHVLHRRAKAGLGAAYLAGFEWGLDRGFGRLVEMDADGSHLPEQLPRLLEASQRAEVVIGSRYVSGGRVLNWPIRRQLLSRGGNRYVRLLLGLGLHDATAGYRVFQADALKSLDLASVRSQGYCFQVDLAWRAVRDGHRVVEVPITFVERTAGESKMNGDIVRESLLRITQWGLRHRLEQVRGLARRPLRRRA